MGILIEQIALLSGNTRITWLPSNSRMAPWCSNKAPVGYKGQLISCLVSSNSEIVLVFRARPNPKLYWFNLIGRFVTFQCALRGSINSENSSKEFLAAELWLNGCVYRISTLMYFQGSRVTRPGHWSANSMFEGRPKCRTLLMRLRR